MIEVCAVWSGSGTPDFDYISLLRLQQKSAHKFNHAHTVVTDVDLDGFDCIKVDLPKSLMHAMIAGVIARLKMPSDGPIVFVDLDVLINRPLEKAFNPPRFDLGLTVRVNDVAPINNGVMYAKNPSRCLQFFEAALADCKEHWGGDQEAISRAAMPMCPYDTSGVRHGAMVMYLSTKTHNNTPKDEGCQSHTRPFAMHFKGDRKSWMKTHYDKYLRGQVGG